MLRNTVNYKGCVWEFHYSFIYKFVNVDYTCVSDDIFFEKHRARHQIIGLETTFAPGAYKSAQRILGSTDTLLALENYRGPFNVNVV